MPATAVMTVPAAAEINAAFEAMLTNLKSRAAALAKKYPNPEAAADDALSFMYANYASAARRGRWLTEQDCGWAAAFYLRNRSLVVPRSARRTLSLNGATDGSVAREVAEALTTGEREDPAERAAARIDLETFTERQPRRSQFILRGLAIGERKCDLAVCLGVSRGRLSQLLDRIGRDLQAYFGE